MKNLRMIWTVFSLLCLIHIDCSCQPAGDPGANAILKKQLSVPGMDLDPFVMARDKANGYLLAGNYFRRSGTAFTSNTTCLIRVDEGGCIIWSKRMTVPQEEAVQCIIPTSDTGFLVSVFPYQSQTANYPTSLIIFRLDKTGNLKWANNYDGGTSVINYLSAICETEDKGFVVETGSFPLGGNPSFFSIFKIDQEGGFDWGHKLSMEKNVNYNIGGVLEKNGFIYATGSIYQAVTPFNLLRSFLTQLDAGTGQPNWTKQNDPAAGSLRFTDLHNYRNGLLINSVTPDALNDLLYTDNDGNPVSAHRINNPYGSLNGQGNILVTPDNGLYFGQSSGMSADTRKEILMRLDSNQQIQWQHDLYAADLSFSGWNQFAPAPAYGMASIGSGMTADGLHAMTFLKLDSTGVACHSGESELTVSAINAPLIPMSWIGNTNLSLTITSLPQDLEPLVIQVRLFCPQGVSGCDLLKLEGPKTICQISDTVRVILHVDPSCPGPVTWTYDSIHIAVLSKTASGLTVRFRKEGAYRIKVQKNGCNLSEDSILIAAGNHLSDVYLPKDTVLCYGSNLVLDPGSGYAGYRWQDGNSQESIGVSTPGVYWVRLDGENGCVSTDTVSVAIAPLPVHFLPGDTVICSYSFFMIQPLQPYAAYLWSTGETSPSIQVNKTGGYSLQVVDKNGCKGADTIRVTTKTCPSDIYFPNAFTPGKAGANHLFRPVVTRSLAKYHFSIYNRLGQRIFEAGDPDKGWDGTLSGADQASGAYVWVCVYQFGGEKENSAKGSLLLIR